MRGFKYTVSLGFSAINASGESVTLDGATDVKPNSDLTVQFNIAVDEATVNENTFVLKTKAGVAVATVRTLSADKKKVTIDPVNTLDVNVDYVLTVSKNVKAESGEFTLATDLAVNFKTADATIQTAFRAGVNSSLI